MFKGLSNFAGLLKQAQQFGGQMEKLTEELKQQRSVGAAGGGMVEVEINGVMEVLRCHIDPQLLSQGDRELIEDLVVAAMNQAVAKSKQQHATALRGLTGGLNLPGLQESLEQAAGVTPNEGPKEP